MVMNLWHDMRTFFPIFSQNKDFVYLDNASTVQKPQIVIDAMSEYTSHSYANIHRWQYRLAEESEFLYVSSKKKVAKLLWWDFREISYTYNATHACNILAQSLVISYKLWVWDVVLLGIRDHHATIVPRQLLAKEFGFSVKFIEIDLESFDIDWKWLRSLLKNNNVKVVMCSHVSNVTGIVYDMTRIRQQLSENIFFAVDGCQAVPHMKIDVNIVWSDAYIFTGHKMMWPTGIGVLWIQKTKSRKLQTLSGWGGIIDSVTREWCSLIRTADKFEPWTPNLIGAVGLAAACDFYLNYNLYKTLSSHENNLISYVEKQLSILSYVKIVWKNISCQKSGILSLFIENPLDFSEKLAALDICVRAGGHCAHPLLHHLWYDKGLVRISVFWYNTMSDMEKLVQSISSFI